MRIPLLLTALLTATLAVRAQQIGAGAYWSMATCGNAVLHSWGSNIYGQLGDSTSTGHYTAAPVHGLLEVVDMQGGFGHTVALAADSTVWCWGRNDAGGLGDGTTNSSIIPVQVPGLDGVIAIAAGDMFSAALKADGTLWTWGENNYGQLGTGIPGNSSVPAQANLTGVTAMAAGNGHLLVLLANGTVWGWGLNDNHQLGAGLGAPIVADTALQAVGLDQVVAISAGRYSFNAALRADGTIWTWGYNQWGQLGNGGNITGDTPAQVPGLTNIVSIARQGGQGHMCAVRDDGTVWSWGYNLAGQLGNGANSDSNVPVQVSNITDVVAVTCGMSHALALKADGTTWAWGSSDWGQLGYGGLVASYVPVAVSGICAGTTEIREPEAPGALSVFPNPASGIIRLRAEQRPGSTGAIHDALGAKVMDLTAAQLSGSEAIDVSGLQAGTYLLRAIDPSGSAAARVVVQ